MNNKRANKIKGNQTIYQIKEVNKRLREEVLALEQLADSRRRTYDDDKYDEIMFEYNLNWLKSSIKEK